MRREATIYAGRPISAPAVAKPQHDGYWRAPTNAPACRSDSYHMRRRGAKSFVDDLVLSRGVVLSRADLFCDLLRLSPLTRRFVSFRLTYLRLITYRTQVDASTTAPVDRRRRLHSQRVQPLCRSSARLTSMRIDLCFFSRKNACRTTVFHTRSKSTAAGSNYSAVADNARQCYSCR